ncbi:MAG: VOC family protein [Gammaproteobacteria bacterium]|nr:VOC family protein [Gammaproteobacteria bacterium]
MPYEPTTDTVDYVEIAVPDVQISRRFFEQLFSWKFTDYGPDYTAFDDGRLNGGFRTRDTGIQNATNDVLVVFYTRDLEAMVQKVEQLGGTICKPIFSFPGGRRFHFRGPDQIEYALWSE